MYHPQRKQQATNYFDRTFLYSVLLQMKVIIYNKTSIESWIEEKVRVLFGSFHWCGVKCLHKCKRIPSDHTLSFWSF